MEIVDRLNKVLNSDELEKSWKESAETLIDDEDKVESLLDWVRGYRDEFLGLTDDVQDPDEVQTSIVVRYIEIKCHWMMLNTQMQYQAVNTGNPDQELMTKGSLISNLLEKLEEFLDEDDIREITEFLSQPMDKLSGDEFA
jgi:hypothetical protein